MPCRKPNRECIFPLKFNENYDDGIHNKITPGLNESVSPVKISIMKNWIVTLLVTLLMISCKGRVDEPIGPMTLVDLAPEVDLKLLSRVPTKPQPNAALRSIKHMEGFTFISFYGDYDEALDQFNALALQSLKIRKGRQKVSCSMYSDFRNPERMLYGRNFDNTQMELLIAYYFPKNGYRSIGFIPMSQFLRSRSETLDLKNPANHSRLLMAPMYTIEGINEKGITLSLASLSRQRITIHPKKETRFLLLIIKEVLDHAATVDEAIAIFMKYNVIDNGSDILSHHILIAGPEGRSVILEPVDGVLKTIPSRSQWQVISNQIQYQRKPSSIGRECWRYEKLHERFSQETAGNKAEGLDIRAAMQLLKDVAQINVRYVFESGPQIISTQWSTLFDLNRKTIYMALHRNFERIIRLKFIK